MAPPDRLATRAPGPAPLWRGVAAATYDGMLLAAVWVGAAFIAVLVQRAFEMDDGRHWQHGLQIYLFLIGLLMFGWFWTHGGQTPGLKAWNLQLQRSDGRPLRWPVAVIRYTAMLACWGVALAPLLLFTPLADSRPSSRVIAWACFAALAASVVATRRDAQRRSPQDRVANTRLVYVKARNDALQRTRRKAQKATSASATVGVAADKDGDQP